MGSGTSWKELEQRISEAIKLPSRAVAVGFLDAAPAGLEEFKGTEPLDAVQPLPEKWVELQVKNVGKDVEISVTDSGRFPLLTAEKEYRKKSETKWDSHSLQQKWWDKEPGWG